MRGSASVITPSVISEVQPHACGAPSPPALEVADVFRRFSGEYRKLTGHALTTEQDRVLREIMVCRTPVMGTHRWRCQSCRQELELCNSCNNRNCPTCQGQYRYEWAEKLNQDLLPIEYHHVIFTAPQDISRFSLVNRGC